MSDSDARIREIIQLETGPKIQDLRHDVGELKRHRDDLNGEIENEIEPRLKVIEDDYESRQSFNRTAKWAAGAVVSAVALMQFLRPYLQQWLAQP